jgi:hypothetical protein
LEVPLNNRSLGLSPESFSCSARGAVRKLVTAAAARVLL